MRPNSRFLPLLAAALLSPLACAQTPADDPVAYWPLDEGSGDTARDASGHGHDLTLEGVRWEQGAVGSALRLEGAAFNVHTALTEDLQPTNAVSVEAWVKVAAFPRNFEGIGLVSAGNSYLLRISSGATPSFHIFTSGWGPVMSPNSMRPGEWYHLAGTYDGEAMRLYVNGELVASRKRNGAVNRPDASLTLGRQVNPLNGTLDEVKVYARARGPEEVASAFAAARDKLNSGLEIGLLVEPFEDLFGPTRDRPAPMPTLEHLPPADLTFAVITDTHIGAQGEEHHYCHHWRVEETMRQINALKPDFVVHCGDMITAFPFHDVFEDQCRYAVEVLKGFDAPVHLVAGNHDIGNQRNMRVWDDKWLARIKRPLESMLISAANRELYLKYFGKDYYSFEAAGCKFIVFDDELCNSGLPAEEEQLQWLEAELQKGVGAKAVFLFTHNPIFWNRPEESGPKNYEPVLEPARSRLLELLGRYPVTALYTGHTHFAFSNRYKGIHMRTLNSTTFNRNYQGVDQKMPGQAQIYDPYKLGYLIVRVQDGRFHESWVPLYWRVGEPPEELARISGGRIVARPSSELQDSVLGIRAAPPKSISHGPEGRELINDHWWRLAEDIGSKWLQAWPPPTSDEEWDALARGLGRGWPRQVKIAVPLPPGASDMGDAWSKLERCRLAIAAVVVGNGAPTDPNGPLTSWRTSGSPADWAEACARARAIVPHSTKVMLARLPLLGEGALERMKEAAAALEGKADGLCVWATTQAAPEEALAVRLRAAVEIARARGLELWLDLAAWQTVEEPRRSAYFLRLLALCQSQRVRVFWWIGHDDAGGLLDSHWDPTPLYYAAQSWQAMMTGPTHPIEMETGEVARLAWQDRGGREYVVWWRQSDEMTPGATKEDLEIPKGATVADPLHGRLLKLPDSGAAPLCSWPLVARGE